MDVFIHALLIIFYPSLQKVSKQKIHYISIKLDMFFAHIHITIK